MTLGVYYQRLVRHGGTLRISIPKEIRHALSLKERDYLVITVKGEQIIMERAVPPFDERKLT